MPLETIVVGDSNTYDVLIIGAGPAGLTAAIYACRANLKVGFIEKDIPGGKMVNINKISNYPGCDNVKGADLSLKMYEQAVKAGATYIYGSVTNVEPKMSYIAVYCEDGSMRYGKSCIIATGTIDTKLGVDGEEQYLNKGVSYCAVCDGALTKDKNVIVFGADEHAVNDVLYLCNIAKHVYLCTNVSQIKVEDSLITKLKKHNNIETIYHSNCLTINGNDNQVTDVIIQSISDKNTRKISVDYVFVAKGSSPASAFLSGLNITSQEGIIKVNQDYSTTVSGIFAAGDITKNQYRQITTAVSDGTIAAFSAIRFVKNTWK
ncbi:MAG: FAD-dependent oxidoreductase [Mycoplasmataceae bacterium]|jgi:thioredoxin reductase (NADPH)|nr:FAD-dependent oxidoreductase [Mycoplasmataceae bacterium]